VRCQAELRRPGLFAALVLCEPILFERDVDLDERSALAARALKRRSDWSDRVAARAYFLGKPMFQGIL
jgi:hypothetical protein